MGLQAVRQVRNDIFCLQAADSTWAARYSRGSRPHAHTGTRVPYYARQVGLRWMTDGVTVSAAASTSLEQGAGDGQVTAGARMAESGHAIAVGEVNVSTVVEEYLRGRAGLVSGHIIPTVPNMPVDAQQLGAASETMRLGTVAPPGLTIDRMQRRHCTDPIVCMIRMFPTHGPIAHMSWSPTFTLKPPNSVISFHTPGRSRRGRPRPRGAAATCRTRPGRPRQRPAPGSAPAAGPSPAAAAPCSASLIELHLRMRNMTAPLGCL